VATTYAASKAEEQTQALQPMRAVVGEVGFAHELHTI
jgi:hypothetical protein